MSLTAGESLGDIRPGGGQAYEAGHHHKDKGVDDLCLFFGWPTVEVMHQPYLFNVTIYD